MSGRRHLRGQNLQFLLPHLHQEEYSQALSLCDKYYAEIETIVQRDCHTCLIWIIIARQLTEIWTIGAGPQWD